MTHSGMFDCRGGSKIFWRSGGGFSEKKLKILSTFFWSTKLIFRGEILKKQATESVFRHVLHNFDQKNEPPPPPLIISIQWSRRRFTKFLGSVTNYGYLKIDLLVGMGRLSEGRRGVPPKCATDINHTNW